MAERKVRHSLVSYQVKKDGVLVSETAFRNQIVDVPDDQVARLDALGATVPVEQDLARPGKMVALPETATEAEILSWVLGATNDEVAALVKERPAMADRIESAQESVQKRFEQQNSHLGGLRKIAAEAEAKAEKASQKEPSGSEGTPPAPEPTPAPAGDGEDLIGGTEFDAAAADALVAEGANPAKDYISENPKHASLVLEAENRLAEQEKREPRVSIVRAAEAAAGFTQ